jgi:hypothetical protein
LEGFGGQDGVKEDEVGDGPAVLTGEEADDIGTPLVKEDVLVEKPANGALALRRKQAQEGKEGGGGDERSEALPHTPGSQSVTLSKNAADSPLESSAPQRRRGQS